MPLRPLSGMPLRFGIIVQPERIQSPFLALSIRSLNKPTAFSMEIQFQNYIIQK